MTGVSPRGAPRPALVAAAPLSPCDGRAEQNRGWSCPASAGGVSLLAHHWILFESLPGEQQLRRCVLAGAR